MVINYVVKCQVHLYLDADTYFI